MYKLRERVWVLQMPFFPAKGANSAGFEGSTLRGKRGKERKGATKRKLGKRREKQSPK